MGFPKDFIWGVASASYQIEGGACCDGRGPSIWDTFSHTPGRVFNNQNGDVSCDAYHRYEEDLDIMKKMGVKNYRFSISWPRVIPDGQGQINELGLAYYDRLVDGCIERGIEPWITLFHWDFPQALQDIGGWANPVSIDAFARYSRIIAQRFKGRVRHFMTFNEPQCMIGLGFVACLHAPGIRLTPRDTFLHWHNILRAHGASCQEIRKEIPDAIIGAASTGRLCYVDNHNSDYTPLLEKSSFYMQESDLPDGYVFYHQWFLEPICKGKYPDDPIHPWSQFAPSIPEEEMKEICQPLDFIALNVYNGHEMTIPSYMKDDENAKPDINIPLIAEPKYLGYPRTALKWPITPPVLYWGPKLINEHFGLPVLISENGQACNDRIFLDGKVHDPNRIDFLHRYLLELKDAVDDGVPVTGYLHWSFTDNMEWHSGYDDRFGLVYIDYRDQRRILKDSAYWYSEVITSNGESL